MSYFEDTKLVFLSRAQQKAGELSLVVCRKKAQGKAYENEEKLLEELVAVVETLMGDNDLTVDEMAFLMQKIMGCAELRPIPFVSISPVTKPVISDGNTPSTSGIHNELLGLQGGTLNERFHLTIAERALLYTIPQIINANTRYVSGGEITFDEDGDVVVSPAKWLISNSLNQTSSPTTLAFPEASETDFRIDVIVGKAGGVLEYRQGAYSGSLNTAVKPTLASDEVEIRFLSVSPDSVPVVDQDPNPHTQNTDTGGLKGDGTAFTFQSIFDVLIAEVGPGFTLDPIVDGSGVKLFLNTDEADNTQGAPITLSTTGNLILGNENLNYALDGKFLGTDVSGKLFLKKDTDTQKFYVNISDFVASNGTTAIGDTFLLTSQTGADQLGNVLELNKLYNQIDLTNRKSGDDDAILTNRLTIGDGETKLEASEIGSAVYNVGILSVRKNTIVIGGFQDISTTNPYFQLTGLTYVGASASTNDYVQKKYVDDAVAAGGGGGGTGVTDGDKGDIIVSGTGTVYTIDTDAVSTAKIANNAVTNAKIAGVSASKVTGLATVATSGAYSDLTGRPTIPTNTTDLTNGSGFITAASIKKQTFAGNGSQTAFTLTSSVATTLIVVVAGVVASASDYTATGTTLTITSAPATGEEILIIYL